MDGDVPIDLSKQSFHGIGNKITIFYNVANLFFYY